MTATADKYRSPYVSEILAEPDRTIDDCTASGAISTAADWTLGEAITRPDGTPMDVVFLRNALRRRIGIVEGGLTLHDANDLIHELDPDLPPLPRYAGQTLRPGQSADGATLRLTFEAWQAKVSAGYVAMLCGNPSGVKDSNSPLRTKQGNDDYPHVIHVSDGNKVGALVKDPLTKHQPGWPGERVTWDDLRQFTEAKKNGQREFGSTAAIATAMVPVGGETQAARVAEKSRATIERITALRDAQKAQVALHVDERDQAIRDLKAADARIAELEAAGQPDCTGRVNDERSRVLGLVSSGVDELVASLR